MMMRMLHPATELLPPSSPTISMFSSSDFDTESTASFFHDRSITLGALLGITTFTFRTPPALTRRSTPNNNNNYNHNRNLVAQRRKKKDKTADMAAGRQRERVRRRNWWWLCGGEASKPSSLGEFLEIERRFGVEVLFDDYDHDHHRNNGRMLFADGRVLPPPHHSPIVDDETPFVCSLCGFQVLLAGICCAGGGGVG